jgi:hypothetical protein
LFIYFDISSGTTLIDLIDFPTICGVNANIVEQISDGVIVALVKATN